MSAFAELTDLQREAISESVEELLLIGEAEEVLISVTPLESDRRGELVEIGNHGCQSLQVEF